MGLFRLDLTICVFLISNMLIISNVLTSPLAVDQRLSADKTTLLAEEATLHLSTDSVLITETVQDFSASFARNGTRNSSVDTTSSAIQDVTASEDITDSEETDKFTTSDVVAETLSIVSKNASFENGFSSAGSSTTITKASPVFHPIDSTPSIINSSTHSSTTVDSSGVLSSTVESTITSSAVTSSNINSTFNTGNEISSAVTSSNTNSTYSIRNETSSTVTSRNTNSTFNTRNETSSTTATSSNSNSTFSPRNETTSTATSSNSNSTFSTRNETNSTVTSRNTNSTFSTRNETSSTVSTSNAAISTTTFSYTDFVQRDNDAHLKTTVSDTESDDINYDNTLEPKTEKPLEPQCGQRFTRIPRIVGGSDSLAGEYPWTVSVRVLSTHFCGGAIINKDWILTAAHCVKRFSTRYYRVRIGGIEVDVDEYQPKVDYHVSQVITHPKFGHPARYSYDIALMKLHRSIQFGEYAEPICLPENLEESYIGWNLTVVGWGRTNEGVSSKASVLQQAMLPVISNSACAKWYEDVHDGYIKIRDFQMCAGFREGGADSCKGDSGGPLVARQGKGRYTLVGVVSAGLGCGRSELPGIYSRVTYFVPWILKTTGGYRSWPAPFKFK